MHWKRVTALTATAMLAAAACGSPSDNANSPSGDKPTDLTGGAQSQVTDAAAKGPAKDPDGAKQGGTVTVYSSSTPSTLDPTDTYYVDNNQIEKLYFRTLTQYRLDGQKAVLVPDLAEDLGQVSADKLTWTFKIKKGIKYQDGTPVKAEDFAYAIKRSFAHDLFENGPAYQLDFFKDGQTYKGPYAGGADYKGVETPDDNTLVIHLAKPFPDLPFYAAFPMFTPIPKARDNRQNYQLKPMSTGPYQVASYSPGTELRLTKNPNWDPNTDPVRHQYTDGFLFKWGGETVKTQTQVLASKGADANALSYENIDASLLPQVNAKREQMVTGPGPCMVGFPMDTRRIPLEVRKAIAVAFPFDQYRKVRGLVDFVDPAASTIMPPAVNGYTKYSLPGLTGKGKGDPAKAKQMLSDGGKDGFDLSWYFTNDDPIRTAASNLLKQTFESAGFKVRAIGVPKTKIRDLTNDPDSPVNAWKAPNSWCSDWPTGSSWIPVLFRSDAIAKSNSMGDLEDKGLDAEIDKISALDPTQQAKEWGKLDKKILQTYLPVIPLYYSNSAFVVGTNLGHVVNDPTQAMPEFTTMFVKS